MEGGRFIIALLLILVIGGGSAYYSYTQTMELQAQLAGIQSKLGPINANATVATLQTKAAPAAAKKK
jgi:hypothetical protein